MNKSISLRHQDAEIHLEPVGRQALLLVRKWKWSFWKGYHYVDELFYLSRDDVEKLCGLCESSRQAIVENLGALA
jgi:hypothetical protein